MKHTAPLIASLLLLIVVSAAYGFLYTSVNGYVERIGAAIQASETLARRDTIARSTEALLADVSIERESLNDFIIGENDVVAVIELLEDGARRQDVTLSISSVSVSHVPDWNRHERIDVLFSVDGTFADITAFVATLEALPSAARVESGVLEPSGRKRWFGSFAITFIKEAP